MVVLGSGRCAVVDSAPAGLIRKGRELNRIQGRALKKLQAQLERTNKLRSGEAPKS